jgi:chromosome segregation protein
VLLKRLTLVGFKSFADRTRLEFDAGVNVVVGPNGTGKSNLLDAIAWVMGTQATRSLRTERMEDVVFAGTATRPALSRAEVSLSFENEDGFLPLDLSEIKITRRLYRDGTSEYELNGAPCRLLDIQELLSDGGVGRHQHVLVSQGQIGSILTARPDEHRAIIEEAAGITKHRNRRDRAVRRLEHTDVDVARLNDILAEQRKRMRPLKRQANAAARHDAVRTEARALRLWLGGEELRGIRRRRSAAGDEHAVLTERLGVEQQERDVLVASLGDLRANAGEVGRALERDTTAAARLETVTERLRRIALVARERRMSFEGRIRGAGERRQDLADEEVDLAGAIEAAHHAEVEAGAESEKREIALAALDDEERSLAEQIQLPTEAVIATLRGDLRALETSADRDRHEREAVQARAGAVTARLQSEASEAEQLDEMIRTTDAEITSAQVAYEAAREQRAERQTTWEADEELVTEQRLDASGAAARVEALQAALDGIGDPESRRLTEATAGVAGSVVARLDVPADLSGAVDGVLGAWRDAFVAEASDVVKGVAESLKSLGMGGVSLVVAPADAPIEVPARTVARQIGAEALIDRLGPQADTRLAEALLGDVVIVEGWAAGWTLVRRHPSVRAATPEGDVISVAGMHMSQPDGAGPAALEAARVGLEIAERELARFESHRVTGRRAFDAAREAERTQLEHLEGLEARLAGHTEALGIVGRAAAEGEAEFARLEARATALEEAALLRNDRIRELRARLAEFAGEEAARQVAWEALNERRAEVAARRDDARRAREEAAARAAAAAERRGMLQTRLEVVQAEQRHLELGPDSDVSIEQLLGIEARANQAIDSVRRHIGVLRERQRELRDRAGVADRRLTDADGRRSELEARLSQARDQTSLLAIELAELRVREEAVAEGLRRDADASEESALAAEPPELVDDANPEERLAALTADLRRMGPINPLAAAEYQELAAEVSLLESQLADLDESRRELRRVISALDEEMATLFFGAFEEISAFYEENFALVFPGGRGRLRLTDPERPLETGVEVEAQPHGKKVGRLSLLSGGERSLAALAFLFAVFRARPSPFYVLDEVEAALDDANLHRFIRLCDTLRQSAQLVIITHQQQTMEAADMLYGVTMEPGGSSNVIAKRMARVPAER